MDDITKFATMPRINTTSILQGEYVDAASPIATMIEDINHSLEQIETVAKIQQHLYKYGLPKEKDEFNTSLEFFQIQLSDDVHESIESLGTVLTRVWNGLKFAVEKLIEFFRTDPYFSQWFNKNEFYCRKVSEYLNTVAKNYMKADQDWFANCRVNTLPYTDFVNKMNTLGYLNMKLNMNSISTKYEELDILHLYGPELQALGFTFTDQIIYAPTSLGYKQDTLNKLGWTPQLVNMVGGQLYQKLLSKHLNMDRLVYSLNTALEQTNRDCDLVLGGRIDGSDQQILSVNQQRVKAIRAMRMIVQESIRQTSILATQWIMMCNRFDFGSKYVQPKLLS